MASALPQNPIRKTSVAYTTPRGRLQTLDLWLPRPLEKSTPSHTTWIIYVHGGAWRDPTQDSTGVLPTIKHLKSAHQTALANIAGIASINYRLSPYPQHATDPSDAQDPQRNVQHPRHVQDVHAAIAYLQAEYGVKSWIGVGHSCGATLLLQLAAGIGLEGMKAVKPLSLLLLAGIYDLPRFLENHAPPACPEEVAQIYRGIVSSAFGGGETYAAVSPVAGVYSQDVWKEGRLVVLGHSVEDELVEGEQRDVMAKRLVESGWKKEETSEEQARIVEVKDLNGRHDEMWEHGGQIAALIAEVVGRLHTHQLSWFE